MQGFRGKGYRSAWCQVESRVFVLSRWLDDAPLWTFRVRRADPWARVRMVSGVLPTGARVSARGRQDTGLHTGEWPEVCPVTS